MITLNFSLEKFARRADRLNPFGFNRVCRGNSDRIFNTKFGINSKAKSFVIIMIVVAVVTLFLRFVILQIIRINIEQNESNAQTTLKLISTALENYAKDNQGFFPAQISALTQNKSPYLDKDYISLSPIEGYTFTCSKLDTTGYNCIASPVHCDLTGRNIYVVTTGGLFISENCNSKKE